MKSLLIVAMLLSGCSSQYEYRQVDSEDYDYGRKVTTHVTESETPIISTETVDFAVMSAVILGVVVVLAAMGGAPE